jgi:hypothetical protein
MDVKLEEFSRKGLRTLCMAMRVIDDDEMALIEQRYEAA